MWELNAFVHEEYLEQCLEISAVYVLAVAIIEKTAKPEFVEVRRN